MNAKIAHVIRRSLSVGLFLALSLILLASWSIQAEDSMLSADLSLVQYEIALDGVPGPLQVVLPEGFEYAGLAPGSDLKAEPAIEADGRTVVWQGPFEGIHVVRFWLASLGPALIVDSLPVSGAGDAVRVEPTVVAPLAGDEEAAILASGSAVNLSKTVYPELLSSNPAIWWVAYTVTFTNTEASPVVLERITDTLPTGFLYGNQGANDEVGPPVDDEEPEIVWENVTIPAGETKKLQYLVRAAERPGVFVNSVVAQSGANVFGPVHAILTVEGKATFLPMVARNYRPPRPVWQLAKSVNPQQASPGEQVQYSVQIQNAGTAAGTVSLIEDQLPSEFVFVSMASGSEVSSPPTGTTGKISWTGSWDIAPGEDLILIYQVTTGGGGEKVNTVTAYDPAQTPIGSASATTNLGGGLPYEETFDTNPPQDWVPFTNFTGLDPRRWYASGGVYVYDYRRGDAPWIGYDLSMYLAPGAQNWTDYRIETRLRDSKEENLMRGLSGIWFRGTYQNSGQMDGKAVGGYYLFMRPDNDTLYLGRIKASDPAYWSYDTLKTFVYPNRIGRKHWYDVVIEVRGNNIEVWFGDEVDGMTKAFNVTDPANAWPHGTVGFGTYYTLAIYDYIRVTPLTD